MEWIVTTGKTVAEAVEAALDQLGVDEADIEYEVLEESKRGFLSRLSGGSPARIKARVKPLSREKPDRRRRSGGRDRDRERKSSGDGGDRAPRARPDRPAGDRAPRERAGSERAGGDRSGGERAGSDRPGGRPPRNRPSAPASAGDSPAGEPPEGSATEAEGTAPASGAGERSSAGSASRNRRRRRKPSGASSGAKATTPETSSNSDEEEAVSTTEVSLEEQAEMAEVFTRGLVERFGMTATVTSATDGDDDVTVEINGEDLGLLIGPRAATIDALQELVRTAVQRRIGGHGARIHVDVAGYRARRQEALAEFARQAAQRAIESGRDQVFEPMSPVDRKIVHDIVNEIEGVATVSEGEEPRRRVVIKALANADN
ncbi:MAG TPA: RNA-binding cell elongation regulator Jag/EloR [Acidimicrobiia bacterium]|nr:RNA-binding cell elongation regulator Jag/EloR [Acidimicrobiia bacterium]